MHSENFDFLIALTPKSSRNLYFKVVCCSVRLRTRRDPVGIFPTKNGTIWIDLPTLGTQNFSLADVLTSLASDKKNLKLYRHINMRAFFKKQAGLASTAMLATFLGFCLEHSGLLTPLMALSITLMQAFGSTAPSLEQAAQSRNRDVVVVTIGQSHFETAYRERSPLDRCVLHSDIQSIVRQRPSILLVDIDLSPLSFESVKERRCQQALDGLLDEFASPPHVQEQTAGRIVVLEPFQRSSASASDLVAAWKRERAQRGVHFSNGEVLSNFGVVFKMPAKPQFAEFAVGNNLSGERFARETAPHVSAVSEPYNFHRFLADPPDSLEFPLSGDTMLADKIVFVGGVWSSTPFSGGQQPSYGDSDRFLTPIGVLDGIYLHAARLVTLRDPIKTNVWLHLLIDFVAGFSVAAFSGWFFRSFADGIRSGKNFGGDWLVSYVLYAICILIYSVVCVFVSYLFVRYGGQQTYPFVIVFFLVIDAFIVNPVEAIAHPHEHRVHPKDTAVNELHHVGDLHSHSDGTIGLTKLKASWLRKLVSLLIVVWFGSSFFGYLYGAH